jgi:uncharacterized protein
MFLFHIFVLFKIYVHTFMNRFIIALTLSLICSLTYASAPSESIIEPWGVDSGLAYLKKEKSESEKPRQTLAQKSCRAMIRFFQVYISPIDGPRSSYYPTSSQYALEAIQKHGVLKGIGMGCDRLLRENGEMWVYPVTEKFGPIRKIDPVR